MNKKLEKAKEIDKILKRVKTKEEYLSVCSEYRSVLFNDDNSGYKYVLFLSPSIDKSEFVSDNLSNTEYSILDSIGDVLVCNNIPLVHSHLSAVPEYREKYNIKDDIPTFILLKNGKEIKKFDSKYIKVTDLISAFNENA